MLPLDLQVEVKVFNGQDGTVNRRRGAAGGHLRPHDSLLRGDRAAPSASAVFHRLPPLLRNDRRRAEVLSMAHRHLGEVEERIRQLQRFHALLAAELAKWDGKTTPTCRGLCQIITSANADGAVEPADSTSRLGRTRTRRLLR